MASRRAAAPADQRVRGGVVFERAHRRLRGVKENLGEAGRRGPLAASSTGRVVEADDSALRPEHNHTSDTDRRRLPARDPAAASRGRATADGRPWSPDRERGEGEVGNVWHGRLVGRALPSRCAPCRGLSPTRWRVWPKNIRSASTCPVAALAQAAVTSKDDTRGSYWSSPS
jgi:hypothetical protein